MPPRSAVLLRGSPFKSRLRPECQVLRGQSSQVSAGATDPGPGEPRAPQPAGDARRPHCGKQPSYPPRAPRRHLAVHACVPRQRPRRQGRLPTRPRRPAPRSAHSRGAVQRRDAGRGGWRAAWALRFSPRRGATRRPESRARHRGEADAATHLNRPTGAQLPQPPPGSQQELFGAWPGRRRRGVTHPDVS